MTTVYSLDIKSYKLFTPVRANTDVIILHGSFDFDEVDNDLITADRQYSRVCRINADDIEEPIPGQPAALFTIELAKSIQKFIKQAVADNHDLVVHCHAGVSRTGAVVESTMFDWGLPLKHTLVWMSGRKQQELIRPVNNRMDFDYHYAPNQLWQRLLKEAYKDIEAK